MTDGERTLVFFLAAYAFTGVALFSGMWAGHKSRVKTHLLLIGLFLVGFAVTIYFADATGRHFTFDAQRLAVHMPCAYTATLATLLPVITGFRKWRGSGSLFAHRAAIGLFMVPFVAASVTGILMLLTRAPK
jgi:hypothetical protein